jgi:hypothetical protein
VYDIVVSGNLAFVADGESGLTVVSIANSASPSLVGTFDTSEQAVGVAVAGDLAFVNDMVSGLHVIDIANPASPSLVGTYATSEQVGGVAVAGSLAFVADGPAGLSGIEVFNHRFNTLDHIGRSLKVSATADPVIAVRLSTTQTPSVTWEISADGGAAWQGITPANAWNLVTAEGNDLRWRSTHTLSGWPASNPIGSDLQIEWLYEFALIDAITDVPNDQGGWVRLKLVRSGRDFAGETSLPIDDYGVWRRIDNAAVLAEIASTRRGAEPIDASIVDKFGALPIFGHDGKVFVQSAPGEMNATLPPGTWELVQNIPALQQQTYFAAIPTLEDSTQSGTNYTVLVVTAHTPTPSIWYASPPDSGYSRDNIAPSVPSAFTAAYNTGNGNTLAWGTPPDPDFQYFRVYRSSNPSFVPSVGTLVHSTTATGWVDPDHDGGIVYYKVTATDFSGNESGPASPGTVTAIDGSQVPKSFAVYPCVPNPFNPTTAIRFDVPAGGGVVTLLVYDVAGRVVATLVDGAQAAGSRTVSWTGRDAGGAPVASGVYFYRFTAPGYSQTHKMVLLK